jgi:hypothetical protein
MADSRKWVCWFDEVRGHLRFQVSMKPLDAVTVELSPKPWFHDWAVREHAAGGGTLQLGQRDQDFQKAMAAYQAALSGR